MPLSLIKLLSLCRSNFPPICIHAGQKQEERIAKYKSFKEFNARILVSTDFSCIAWGVLAVSVPRGLAISFISSEPDQEILDKVRVVFEVNIPELPDGIDASAYT
ncbi:hypothetical protein ACHAW5_004806 [Stephanodiscus triporus]|uniref:Helicase C-terminal domain-containing protein n=1 Tax=Stephanodiscus triporus TaxID=2934178 RepID=A0ABD3MQP0_9STRA